MYAVLIIILMNNLMNIFGAGLLILFGEGDCAQVYDGRKNQGIKVGYLLSVVSQFTHFSFRRYVDHCQMLAVGPSALQISRRSRFATATTPPRRLHDQANVFGIHQWTRWHEEMAPESVFIATAPLPFSDMRTSRCVLDAGDHRSSQDYRRHTASQASSSARGSIRLCSNEPHA